MNQIDHINQMSLSDLFDLFLDEPQLLPDEWKKKLKQENELEIVIGDYIASMTDKMQ